MKEDLEGELEAVTKKAKEAAAKASAETSEMSTKLALLEQQGKFAEEEKARLAQQQVRPQCGIGRRGVHGVCCVLPSVFRAWPISPHQLHQRRQLVCTHRCGNAEASVG